MGLGASGSLTRTQPSMPPDALAGMVPFRGLTPFIEADAEQFFGRQRLVNRMLERLLERGHIRTTHPTAGHSQPGSSRVLVVIGPSGSGKTSLVRAGLLPQLGAQPGGPLVSVRIDHPSLDPFGQLERQGMGRPAEDLISSALAYARGMGAPRLLLFCDHAEELLLLAPQKRAHVVEQLVALAGADTRAAGVDLFVVLALRADCVPPLATAAPTLLPLLEAASVNLPATLDVSEWTAMVEAPARVAGVVIEDGLLGAIAHDLDELSASLRDGRRGGAALPLLAFVLARLWEIRTSPMSASSQSELAAPIVFTAADYQNAGGLGQALPRWAEGAWAGIGAKLHPAARRVLLELVSGRDEPSGPGGTAGPGAAGSPSGPVESTRPLLSRPRSLGEMRGALRTPSVGSPSVSRAPDGSRLPPGRTSNQNSPHGLLEGTLEALQALAASGLIRIDVSSDLVELIHPALLSEWRDLGRFYRDEQRFHVWLREISALAYREGPSGATATSMPSTALTGGKLAEAEAWLESRPAQIPEGVQRLITSSMAMRGQAAPRPSVLRDRARSASSQQGGPSGRVGLPIWALALGALAPLVLGAGLFVQDRGYQRDQARLATDLQSERGARAALLVQHPGQDSAALALGVQAVAPSVRAGRPVPAAAKEGLMTAFSVAKNSLPLYGHRDRVGLASFDPSGLRVLTCSHDHTARIWDSRSGQPLVTLEGHRAQLTAAVFSRDGGRVLTTSMDHTARIWDARSGQMLVSLEGHGDLIETGSLSPDGLRAVTAGHDRVAKVWDTRTGQLIATLSGHTDRLTAAAFSPDGKTVLTASWDHTARLWDAASGQLIRVLAGHNHRVNLAMFSPDGTRVVTGGWDHTARLFDLNPPPPVVVPAALTPPRLPAAKGSPKLNARAAAGRIAAKPAAPGAEPEAAPVPLPVVPPGTPPGATPGTTVDALPSIVMSQGTPLHSLAFSPDGRLIATAGTDGIVKLWDGRTGEARGRFDGHAGSVEGIDFAPDSQHLVTAGVDRTVRLWDVRAEAAVAVLRGHSGEIYSVTFAPSGAQVVTASYDRTARVWDVRAGLPLGVLRGHTRGINSAAFSPDGTRLITTSDDYTARLWRWPVGDTIAVLNEHHHAVICAAFSPDGKLVATGGNDYRIRLWDGRTGELVRTLEGHSGPVFALAFSPDGRRLVSGGADHTVRVWSATEGTTPLRVAPGHSGELPWLAFSPDGTLLVSAGTDGVTEIRDGQDARTLRRLEGYSATVNTAVFLPTAVSAAPTAELITGADDGTIRTWDARTGRQLRTLQTFADAVLSARLSPDGRRLIIATRDQRVRLWDMAAEMPLAVLPAFPEELVVAAYASGGPSPGVLGAQGGTAIGRDARTDATAGALPAAMSSERRQFLIASVDGTTKIYADDYPANLAGTLTDACARLRHQPEYESVKADCEPATP